MGYKLYHKPHKFSWECAVGNKRVSSNNALAAAWRELARRTEDIARIQSTAGAPPLGTAQKQALDKHKAALLKIADNLPNGIPPPLKEELTRWVLHYNRLTGHASQATRKNLAGLADKRAAKLESAARLEKMQSWRTAIGATADSQKTKAPSRLAYRWLKGLTGWSKSPLGPERLNENVPDEPEEHDDLEAPHCGQGKPEFSGTSSTQIFSGSVRTTPLCDQAAIEVEADQWAELWREKEQYQRLDWGEVESLPALLPEAIRAAAASFPVGTGLGVDHIPPRALLRLSDESIAALAKILMVMGKRGEWCEALNMVMIVLLAKEGGGFRPIGLFPTIIRVWMRARMTQIRAWEAANHSEELYGGKGMGAQRAAWVESFSAEAAVLEHEDHAQAMLDLTKAFELVDHAKLLDAAKRRGYPLALLRMSLSAYRLSRTIGVDGCFSRTITATRGITAGSGFATSELRLLLLDVLEETHRSWGASVRLTLYVDDLTISVKGATSFVKNRLAAVIDQVVCTFHHKLALQVSVAKSVVVVSRLKLAKAVARRSKAKVLKPAASAKLLGTGVAGGARRSTRVIKARLQKLRSSASRMWALRKQGVNTKLMARMAGTSSITYGDDIQGVSNTLLAQQVSTVARLASPEGGGRNPTTALYVIDGPNGTLDPTFSAHTLPLLHWSTAFWETWVSKEALEAAFQHVPSKMSHGKASWHGVAGPAAALWVTLDRVQWKWISASTFNDDLGDQWDARADPPIVIVNAMRRTIRRRRFLAVAALHTGLLPQKPDVGAAVHGRADTIVDFANILAPLANGKVDKLADTPEFSRRHAAALLSATAGGQWPQTRKAAVPRWAITDDKCQLCHLCKGTLQHRRECNLVAPPDGWSEIPEKAKLAADTIGAERLSILKTTGLLAIKLPSKRARVHDTLYWGKKLDANAQTDITWYIDGSQLFPRRRELSTLGFALAAVSGSGELLAWGWGTPPKWCDSASAAEAWALCTVLRHAAPQDRIIIDCLGLLKTASAGKAAATSAKKALARTWHLIAHHLDGRTDRLAPSTDLDACAPDACGHRQRTEILWCTHNCHRLASQPPRGRFGQTRGC